MLCERGISMIQSRIRSRIHSSWGPNLTGSADRIDVMCRWPSLGFLSCDTSLSLGFLAASPPPQPFHRFCRQVARGRHVLYILFIPGRIMTRAQLGELTWGWYVKNEASQSVSRTQCNNSPANGEPTDILDTDNLNTNKIWMKRSCRVVPCLIPTYANLNFTIPYYPSAVYFRVKAMISTRCWGFDFLSLSHLHTRLPVKSGRLEERTATIGHQIQARQNRCQISAEV